MNNQLEIERLQILLKGRREEYKIFGRTSEDAEKDAEIIRKIKSLK